MDAGPRPSIAASKHDRYIVVHAVFGSLAALVLLPAAVLLGRYGRTWRHWNNLHIAINALTVVFVIITFALGNAALKDPNQYTGPHSDVHHKLGLAIFLLILIQAIFGIGAKLVKKPSFNYVTLQRKRHPLRLLHIAFGIATAAILYAQVYTGFGEWNMTSDSMTIVPRGIVIAFWVLFALEVFAYIAGWPIMEYLGRKTRAHYQETNPEMKEGRTSTSGLLA